MAVLHVAEQGARITCRNGALRVEKGNAVLFESSSGQVEFVAIYGGVAVTSQAAGRCMAIGVPIAYFSLRGDLKGVCISIRPRNADLRLAQYARRFDAGKRLELAQAVVAAKLHNAACLLGDLAANHPEWNLLEERDHVLAMAERAAAARDEDSLRGVEGAGTAAYFAALRRAFPEDSRFLGRKAHPATDPANALLSLSYSMLAAELTSLIEGRGLDSCLGFYHGVRSGFASLAYDLLELFRHAVCDRLVLTCLNLRIIKPGDFQPAEAEDGENNAPRGLRLKNDAMKVFLASYEKAILRGRARPKNGALGGDVVSIPSDPERQSIREIIRAEVEAYIRDLRGTDTYRPFRWREKP